MTLNPHGEPVTVIVPDYDPAIDTWWANGPPWQEITKTEIIALYGFLVLWAADWGYTLYLWL